MQKKVLIIGGTGMLGHMVYKYLDQSDKYRLSNSVYKTKLTEDSIICDVTEKANVEQLFTKTQPDIVINCVGALIQESRDNPANAIYLNALLPHTLKNLADEYNAKLIHVSTDCVFSGEKGNYAEDDFRDADDTYGRSKALGEIFDEPHCTLRTSIVGPELKENGTGLYHWFMQQNDEVKGFTNAFWGGVTTLELAKAIDKAITHDLKGLFHVTNGEKISKFNLLHLFNQTRDEPLKITPYHDFVSDKSLRRSSKFDFEIPSYKKMITAMGEYNS